MSLTRRTFLKATAAAVVGATAVSALAIAVGNESNDPVVEQVSIPVRNLAPALQTFTIVQLSDFHLYPFTKLDLIRRSVQLANDLRPGVIVLTGDFVWRNVEAIHDLAPALAQLNARHGVFAILGNHDLWTDVRVVKSALTAAGLPILDNQGLTLQEGEGRFYLAGLDDGWSGHPDLDAALVGAPTDVPIVLLVHEPDLADRHALNGRIALQLSGHSHGGQIRLPGKGAFALPELGTKYDMGLYRVRDMWLYTNRGIGCIIEPFRFNCAPEITCFTLVRA